MSELACVKETLEKVSKAILECPACLEGILVTPVYHCTNGHLLCEPCNKKVKVCPVCQEELGNKRNYAIEKLVNAINPVFYCPKTRCGERVSEKKLEEHFQKKSHQFNKTLLENKNNHIGQFGMGNEPKTKCFNKSYLFWLQDLYPFNKEKFYDYFFKDEGFYHYWIYCQGKKEVAKKYFYEIKFSNGNHVLLFKGQTVSMEYPEEDVIENGWGLTFSTQQAKVLWAEDDSGKPELQYKVTFYNV